MAPAEAPGVAPQPRTEADRAACLDEARRGFARACGRAAVVERSYSIAGRSIALRIAGPALVTPLTAALEHHRSAAGGRADLTINAWDIAGTGVPMPPFPESAIDGGRSAKERVQAPEGVRIQYQFGRRALCVLDRAADEAYVSYSDATTLPYWELGSPLLTVLHWWMHEHGRQLVHGAALGTERGGVLLVAPGGSGKSSTALATLSAAGRATGLRYAGDDYCLVGLEPEPWAYSLYGTGKLDAGQVARFPDLLTGPVLNPDRSDGEKIVVLVSRGAPEQMIHDFQVLSLVVPVIDGGPCRVAPISAGGALRALAPSTVLQLSGAGGATLAALAELARRVPTHALHLSPDPREAPAVLAALIDELAG